MRNDPVNQTVIRPTPVIIYADTDIHLRQIGWKRMAIDKQRFRGQSLNQSLLMFMETIESELFLTIRNGPLQQSESSVNDSLPYLFQRIVLEALNIAEETRERVRDRNDSGIQPCGRSK